MLNDESDGVSLKNVPDTVTRARLLRDNTPLTLERDPFRTLIMLLPDAYDPFDTVIALNQKRQGVIPAS